MIVWLQLSGRRSTKEMQATDTAAPEEGWSVASVKRPNGFKCRAFGPSLPRSAVGLR